MFRRVCYYGVSLCLVSFLAATISMCGRVENPATEEEVEEEEANGNTSTDETAPVLSSLSSGGSALQTTGSLISSEATFTIIFSETMETATVTTSSVTLAQNNGTAIAISIAESTVDSDGVAGNEFTVTPSASLSSNAQYVLTIFGGSGGVADLSGNVLAENATYTMTTRCSSSDNFDEDNSNCYRFINTLNHEDLTGFAADLAEITFGGGDVMSFNLPSGSNFVDKNPLSSIPAALKPLSGDFSVQIRVVTATMNGAGSGVGLGIFDAATLQTGHKCVFGGNNCFHNTYRDGVEIDRHSEVACKPVPDFPYNNMWVNLVLRISRSNGIMACAYKLEGSETFVDLPSLQSPTVPDAVYLSLFIEGHDNASFTADDLIFNSGVATDQD